MNLRQQAAQRALSNIHRILDTLYLEHFERGTTPGIFEAKRVFDELMGYWKQYRSNR